MRGFLRKIASAFSHNTGKSENAAAGQVKTVRLAEQMTCVAEQVKELRSDVASLKTMINVLTAKQGRQEQNLLAVADFLLLKEVNPELVRIITRLPEFAPAILNDFYNRFAWRDKSARKIRQLAGDLVMRLSSPCNMLTIDEIRFLARDNLDRTANTERYPRSVDDYIKFLAASNDDRLPAEDILPECRSLLQEGEFFRNEYRRSWFLYFTLLLEAGEKNEAKRLVLRWNEKFGHKDFWEILPLAHFVRGLGLTNSLVEKAADVWESYLRRLANGPPLADLLTGRSVAVVGNGPQEVSLGLGAEIDAHDAVIRFNSYRINENTVQDYGRRVDICFTNPIHFGPPDKVNDLEALIFIDDYSRIYWINEAFLDRTLSYIKSGKTWYHFGDMADIFAPLHRRIQKEAEVGIRCPTAGYKTAVTMRAMRPDFSLKNIYGFSCKSPQPFNQDLGYHYDPGDPINRENLREIVHNHELERLALRWLFLGEKPSGEGLEGA